MQEQRAGVDMLMSITDDLENGYMAVLRGIEDTSATLENVRHEKALLLSNKDLDDCLERLDGYAENLYQLDQRLSSIAENNEEGSVMERFRDLPRYSALMQLGTSVYDRLYSDYSALSKLRNRRIFIRLSCCGIGLIILSVLMLPYL